MSDNGSQFISADFEKFLKQNGVRHVRTAPYHPASNGAAEHFVQTFKQALKASANSSLPLQQQLGNFLLKYRTTPHTTTGETPSQLFLGRQVRTRLDLLRPDSERRVCSKQAAQKQCHDRKARWREFHVGDWVMARDWRSQHQALWQPGVVAECYGPLSYVIHMDSGLVWRRHVDSLRLLGSRVPESGEPEIEPEMKLPTREASTESASSVCSPECSADSDTIPVSSTVTLPDSSHLPVIPSQHSPSRSPHPLERRYPERQRKPPDRLTYS